MVVAAVVVGARVVDGVVLVTTGASVVGDDVVEGAVGAGVVVAGVGAGVAVVGRTVVVAAADEDPPPGGASELRWLEFW